jgi:mono/diheme cytochrome c family protein
MKLALWFCVFTAIAQAQQASVERGAALYRMHCATPYCHGPEGTAGRAPRLVGHRFNVNQMFKAVTWGIPGTGMPEFTTRLKTGEIADIVAYVMTLGGSPAATSLAPAAPPRVPTPEAKQGRALFFDAARTTPCGSCHEFDGWGVPVGPDLSALPPDRFTGLREIPARRIMTARPRGGEPPFPALLVEKSETRVRVYDLTNSLPVLRTFSASQVVLDPGGPWRHQEASRAYTARELETIAAYLRWMKNGL